VMLNGQKKIIQQLNDVILNFMLLSTCEKI